MNNINFNNETNNELNLRRAYKECASVMSRAIDSNFDGLYLNKGFENEITDTYGITTVLYVLATTINQAEGDGRYSLENRKFYKVLPWEEDRSLALRVSLSNHPCLVDGVATRIRRKCEGK